MVFTRRCITKFIMGTIICAALSFITGKDDVKACDNLDQPSEEFDFQQEDPDFQQDVDDGWGHFYHEEGTTVVEEEPTPGYTKEQISQIVLGANASNQNEIYEYLLDNFVMSDDYISGDAQYKVKRGDIIYIERRTASAIEKLFCESGKNSLAVVEKVYQKKHYFGTTVTTAVVVDIRTGRRFETSLNGKLDPVFQVTQTNPNNATLRQQLGVY